MNFACQQRASLGMRGFEPEMFQDRCRSCRIEGKPRPYGRARGVVDLIDQAGCELDELAGFFLAMRAGLNVEIRENAQQSGANIDALAPGERHQSVETVEHRNCGHAGRAG